jgi:glycosyltransferase involved in cell wall biosynthesis
MRIGIDARAAAEVPAGRGTMVRELLVRLAASEHEVVAYAREPWGDVEVEWDLIASRDPFWHWRAARRANKRCDVFLSMNSYLTVWFLRIASVMVVCDLVAFEKAYRPQKRAGLIERVTLPFAVRRANVITAISQATADDLIAAFPAAGGKTMVTLLAADERFAAKNVKPAARDKPYVLSVGTLEPRKNIPALLAAFDALPAELRDSHEVVLVGPSGWDTGETDAAMSSYSFVSATGHVSEDELLSLYRGATLFAYPSLYEGFGLPVLEAMKAGVPVLTSDISSLPEVAGDAAIYANPRNIESITAGLERGLSDKRLRTRLVKRGSERAATFSWERYAAEMLMAADAAVSAG